MLWINLSAFISYRAFSQEAAGEIAFHYETSLRLKQVSKRNTAIYEQLFYIHRRRAGTDEAADDRAYRLSEGLLSDYLYDCIMVELKESLHDYTAVAWSAGDEDPGMEGSDPGDAQPADADDDNSRSGTPPTFTAMDSGDLVRRIYEKGFTIRGVPLDEATGIYRPEQGVKTDLHYIPFIASASNARRGEYLFVRDDLARELMERMTLDIVTFRQDKRYGMAPVINAPLFGHGKVFNAAKLSAYIGLGLSDGVSVKECLARLRGRTGADEIARLKALLTWDETNTVVVPDADRYPLNADQLAPYVWTMQEQSVLPEGSPWCVDAPGADAPELATLLDKLAGAWQDPHACLTPEEAALLTGCARQALDQLPEQEETVYFGRMPLLRRIRTAEGKHYLPLYALLLTATAYIRANRSAEYARPVAIDKGDIDGWAGEQLFGQGRPTLHTLNRLVRESDKGCSVRLTASRAGISITVHPDGNVRPFAPELQRPHLMWGMSLIDMLCRPPQEQDSWPAYWVRNRDFLDVQLRLGNWNSGDAMAEMLGMLRDALETLCAEKGCGSLAGLDAASVHDALGKVAAGSRFQQLRRACGRKDGFDNLCNMSDGMGFATPEVFEAMEVLLSAGAKPDPANRLNAVIIRLPQIKGVLIKLDFHRLFSEQISELQQEGVLPSGAPGQLEVIRDVFDRCRRMKDDHGNPRIKVIFTRSMFKACSIFENMAGGRDQEEPDPWKQYWDLCRKYSHGLLIAGKNSAPAGTVRLNYQFLSTMDIREEELRAMVADTLDKYTGAGLMQAETLLPDQGNTESASATEEHEDAPEDNPDQDSELTDDDAPFHEKALLQALLEKQPALWSSTYVRSAVLKEIRTEVIDRLMRARLTVPGDIRLCVGDVDAICRKIICRQLLSRDAFVHSPINDLGSNSYGLGQYYAPGGADAPWSLQWLKDMVKPGAAQPQQRVRQFSQLLGWWSSHQPARIATSLDRLMAAVLDGVHAMDGGLTAWRELAEEKPAEAWNGLMQAAGIQAAAKAFADDTAPAGQVLVMSRNPHLSRGESAIVAPLDPETQKKYDDRYGHLTGVVFCPNAALYVMGGADCDGDRVNLCTSLTVLEAVSRGNNQAAALVREVLTRKNELARYCIGRSAADNSRPADETPRDASDGENGETQQSAPTQEKTRSRKAAAKLFGLLAQNLQALPAWHDGNTIRKDCAIPLIFAGSGTKKLADTGIDLFEGFYDAFRLTGEQRIGIDSLACLQETAHCYNRVTGLDENERLLHHYLTHLRLWNLALQTGLEIDMAKTSIRAVSVPLMTQAGEGTLGIAALSRRKHTPYRAYLDAYRDYCARNKRTQQARVPLRDIGSVVRAAGSIQAAARRLTEDERYGGALNRLPDIVLAVLREKEAAIGSALGNPGDKVLLRSFLRRAEDGHALCAPDAADTVGIVVQPRQGVVLDTAEKRMCFLIMAYLLRTRMAREEDALRTVRNATYLTICSHMMRHAPMDEGDQALEALLPSGGGRPFLEAESVMGDAPGIPEAKRLPAGATQPVAAQQRRPARKKQGQDDVLLRAYAILCAKGGGKNPLRNMSVWLSRFYCAQSRAKRAEVLRMLLETAGDHDSRLHHLLDAVGRQDAEDPCSSPALHALTDEYGIILFKQLLKLHATDRKVEIPRRYRLDAGQGQSAVIPASIGALRAELLKTGDAEQLYRVTRGMLENEAYNLPEFLFLHLNREELLKQVECAGKEDRHVLV